MGEEKIENQNEGFYLKLLTHDIKNLNQGACGYMELMTMMPETTVEQKKFLEEALSYIRMSSNLIMSIEAESDQSGIDQTIDLENILANSVQRLSSLNTTLDIKVDVDGFESDIFVRGNLLWVDLFTYIMDFIVKRSRNERVRIKLRRLLISNGGLKVTISGNMQKLDINEQKFLFTKGNSNDSSKGKLLLCRSIADRFGGSVIFLPESDLESGPGEFLITLKGVEK